MKKIKRFLSVFLALIMIISIVPMSLFTVSAEDSATSGTCGENVTWTFDESTGTLTISGTGAMYDYDYGNRPFEDYEYYITTVVINDGVTTIGDCAFYECTSLTSVTIPDSVTTIGEHAFYYCTNLTSVTIPDSVTSIGNSAFSWCENLTSVTIPDSVTTISDGAFSDCTGLKSVTIPDTVTTIGDNAFLNCFILTSVKIPNSVTTIGDFAFYCCGGLTNVKIGNNVTTIGNSAFAYCVGLTSVTIPNSVTSIGNSAFEYCNNLTSITIPDSVTTIGDYAFEYCDNLTRITIPDSVTTIGDGAFCSCENLTSITVDSNNQYYSSNEYGVLFNKDKTTLVQYPAGNTITSYTIPDSVTTIGNSAFEYCTSLTSITIPDSVTTIGNFAFAYCTSLKSVTIPDSVTSIGRWAFSDCTSLTYVYYSGSEEQWNEISIGSYNSPLLNATIHFNSTGMPLLSVSDAKAQAGETVDVTIDISNNLGVASVLLKVGFDDSVLTLKKVTDGGILGAAFHSNAYKNPYTLSWVNDTSEINFTTNGTLVTLTFEVSEDVAEGTTLPITVSYDLDNYDIIDVDMNPVSVNVINGEINIIKCSHTRVIHVGAKPSTCVVQGNEAYTVCNDCGKIISGSDAKLPLGNHSYDMDVTPPTCTEKGYTTYTCIHCGDTYIADEVDATGHDYTANVKAPTCTEKGYTTYTCIHCGDSYTGDETPVTRHRYVKNICKYCGKVLPADAPAIEVSQKTLAIVGKQVKVAISLKNNPGITSMLLSVNYDMDKLQLVSVEDSGNLGAAYHSNVLNSPYTLSWANDTSTTNYTYNGEVVILTFNVYENAELGETPITVSYDYDNYDIIDKDMSPVEFAEVDGIVEIIDVIIGDVNEDGKVNTLDRVILTRYIAKWGEYPAGSINTVAADVNCDGKVNTLDRVILTRYIAKWSGYETLPYTG